MRLILGSGSPRRLELLAQIGVVPDDIRAPEIDETPLKNEQPRPYCSRIAFEKVQAVKANADDLVLCADTTVALGRRIFGKPNDAGQAAEFLLQLAGRRHNVITAIALKRGDKTWRRDVVTAVKMKRLSDSEINAYLASNDWQGKAGAYAIQGPAGAFIPWIQGSFSAVMGLPVAETATLLVAAGYPLYRTTTP
ncbi:MAG: nucleoside triphosphate pyrophosphatase [Paracoccaceae bacterium]